MKGWKSDVTPMGISPGWKIPEMALTSLAALAKCSANFHIGSRYVKVSIKQSISRRHWPSGPVSRNKSKSP
jgi:hypothetical protein